MLFLVQLRHDAAHCPGYHRELIPQWVEGVGRRDEIAAQVGVKLHAWYSALPEHLEIAIVEADSPIQIAAMVTQVLPGEQSEIKLTALTPAEDMLAMARRMSEG